MYSSKRLLKILSTVLAILVVVGILPLSTIAADVNESASIRDAIESVSSETDKSSEIITEVESGRDEYTKVFKKADGSYTAIISAAPLHYEEDGEWIDIDNTLVEKTVDGKEKFVNKSNEFTVELPCEMSKDSDVTIKKDDFELSFELELPNIKNNNGKAIGKVKNGKTEMSKGNSKAVKFAGLEKKNSKVTYENISENTSIEYNVTPSDLKENIIIDKKPKSEVTYTYNIKAENLIAEKNEDGSIDFYASDNIVFSIPAPVMFDAKGKESTDIEVGLSGNKGNYILTYTPSYDWLKKNAKYPVTIDPVVESPKDDTGIDDTLTRSQYPNRSYGSFEKLYVGTNGNGTFKSYISTEFIYFFAASAVIKSVKLNLKCRSTPSLTLVARNITSSWKEKNSANATDGLTANNLPNIDSEIIDYVNVSSADVGNYVTFDLTKLYIDKNIETYGVELDTYNNGQTGENVTADTGVCTFSSSNYAVTDPTHAPYYEIEYYESNGISDIFDYQTVDTGRAGTMYVNEFTNQLFIERDELGIDGNVMPVHIKRYYSELGINSLTNFLETALSAYGPGWNMNYTQWIEYNDLMLDNKGIIIYLNDQGNAIYFEASEDPGDTKTINNVTYKKWNEITFEHIGDTGCTLFVPVAYENDIANNYDKIIIEDASGQLLKFNTKGALCEIVSSENPNDKITITHTSRSMDIDTITDGAGHKYVFSYYDDDGGGLSCPTVLTSIQVFNADNTPVKVKNANGNDVDYKITYNGTSTPTQRYFTSATYPDGETVYYDTNSATKYIRNVDGYTVSYEPLSDGTLRISEYIYNPSSSNDYGNYIDIVTNETYSKSFTDRYSNTETHQFDAFGRTVAVQNDSGNVTYSIYSSVNLAGENENDDIHNLCVNSVSTDIVDENEINIVTNGDFTTDISSWTVNGTGSKVTQTNNSNRASNLSNGVIRLTGSKDTATSAYQIITLADSEAGDSYSYSAWAKAADALPLDEIITFSVSVSGRIGTGNWALIDKKDFNPHLDSWQFTAGDFDLPEAYDSLMVVLSYAYQLPQNNTSPNYAFFDGIKLVKTSDYEEPPETESGETENESSCPCENCEEYNCACNCVDEASCTCPQCKRGTTTTYDNHGNVLTETKTDGTISMGSVNTYSANGNTLATSKDDNGITATYSYNNSSGSGLPQTVTIGNQSVNYTYSAMGEIQNLSQSVSGLYSGSTMSVSCNYDNDRITSVEQNGFDYTYEYDIWGNITNVKVDGDSLISYTYGTDEFKDRISKITYGNGQEVFYNYDSDSNVIGVKYSGDSTWRFTYTYTDGELTSSTDTVQNTTTTYTDDGYTVTNNTTGAVLYSVNGNEETYNGETHTTEYNENLSGYNQTSGITTDVYDISGINSSTKSLRFTDVSDWFGRTSSKTVLLSNNNSTASSVTSNYTYKSGSGMNTTTNLIQYYMNEVKNGTATTSDTGYYYTYDNKGNIETVSTRTAAGTTTLQYKYYYDEANQLVRVNDKVQNKTYSYVYNKGGNIHTVKTYNYTTGSLPSIASRTDLYTYATGWKDKLTYVRGKHLTYDDIGNLLKYDGKTHTWKEGRQLATFSNDDYSVSYKYDVGGLRTKKTVTSGSTTTTYNYTWANGMLIGQTDGTNTLRFVYNGSEPVGFVHNNSNVYLYTKNLQGDIVGIVNESGSAVVNYAYDAWGKLVSVTGSLASTIGAMNPIRYRGYYYDTESGYYYLQSRYYDPEICRFINADSTDYLDATGTVLGCNLFAYCENDPVNCVDVTGTWAYDVHNGYSEKKQSNTKVYKGAFVSYQKGIGYYGTYYWACICGIKPEYAKIIAYNCNDVDRKYNPAIDQEWHFNVNKGTKKTDSRKIISLVMLAAACAYFEEALKYKKGTSNYKTNVNNGLVYLGYALHPIQDMYAHTDDRVHKLLVPVDDYNGYTIIVTIWYHSPLNNTDSAKRRKDQVDLTATATISILKEITKTYSNILEKKK